MALRHVTHRRALRILCVIFLTLASVHVYIGYADNGDFNRSVAFVIAKPRGFLHMWSNPGDPEFALRFYTRWHRFWELHEDGIHWARIFSWSSYKPLIWAQIWLSNSISGQKIVYDVVLGSLLTRVIWILGMTAWIRASNRTQLNPLGAIVLSIGLFSSALDASFSAFLNSFYEDQVALIFMPWLGFFLTKHSANPTQRNWSLLMATAAIIGFSKTTYFLTPAIVGMITWRTSSKSSSTIAKTLILLMLQLLCSLPAWHGKYKAINQYHAYYYGVLMVSEPAERNSLKLKGFEIEASCIAEHAFSQKGEICLRTVNPKYSDTLKVLLYKPAVAFRAAQRVQDEGRKLRISYLKMTTDGQSGLDALPIFSLWTHLFSLGVNSFAIAFVVVMTLCQTIYRQRFMRILSGTSNLAGATLGILGLYMYIAAFGDGFFEMPKHLVMANYALILAVSAFLSDLASKYFTKILP